MAAAPQAFGVIPTGCEVITTPTQVPSETSFMYALPPRTFSHIVVFQLPGITLPPNTAAAVYLALPSASPTPNFKFLGGIGPGKESAIFKVNREEVSAAGVMLGISIESAESVGAQMATLSTQQPQNVGNGALVLAKQPTTTVVLAQRIIKNAFNFLASFSGNVPVPGGSGTAGVEVVPLKAFQDWWTKFESRVKNDPGFLERDVD